jgi:hypothetical protein
MWISVEGAGLLAQILPVGILIIVVESRAAARAPRRKVNRLVFSRASSFVTGMYALLGLPAIAFCVIAVNSGRGLTGVMAWIVSIAAILIGVGAGAVLLDLVEVLTNAERTGLDGEAAPASKGPPSKPRGPSKSGKRRGRK